MKYTTERFFSPYRSKKRCIAYFKYRVRFKLVTPSRILFILPSTDVSFGPNFGKAFFTQFIGSS
jgi:hypothetical protein